jgi:hypothetical protein
MPPKRRASTSAGKASVLTPRAPVITALRTKIRGVTDCTLISIAEKTATERNVQFHRESFVSKGMNLLSTAG